MDLDRRTGEGLALPIAMHGLDFLFLATVVVGLYAIHRILGVSAWTTARRREVLGALFVEMRDQMPQPLRAITTVPTVRDRSTSLLASGRAAA